MTGPAERARLAELAAIVERDREWDSPEPVTWPKHLELVRAAAADRRWLLARLAALEAVVAAADMAIRYSMIDHDYGCEYEQPPRGYHECSCGARRFRNEALSALRALRDLDAG